MTPASRDFAFAAREPARCRSAWLEQGATENNRMWAQMRRSPLFGFLDRFIGQRQAEGVFRRDAAPDLLSASLVALPVHHAIVAKLYGIESEFPDEQVVDTYARLLLDGLRGGMSAGAPTVGRDPV